eukprot:8713363-Pyramimonas_sp.AAC.1
MRALWLATEAIRASVFELAAEPRAYSVIGANLASAVAWLSAGCTVARCAADSFPTSRERVHMCVVAYFVFLTRAMQVTSVCVFCKMRACASKCVPWLGLWISTQQNGGP